MLSIGLVTYNHEKYIEDALKGLLAQNIIDAELVILDDASRDNTQKIIQKYLEKLSFKYKRVVNICHEVNTANVSKNVNEIVDVAEGEYLWLIAGDDILLNNVLEKMYLILRDQPECAVVYANMIKINDNYHFGDSYDINSMFLEMQKSGIQKNMYHRLMRACCVPAPAAIKRMSLYTKYGKHDEEFFAEDYEYWIRISREEKFYYFDEPVVLYRQAETSLTNYRTADGCKKIQRMMNMDFCIKKKYISFLNNIEQAEVWRCFYTSYTMLCKEIGYDDGCTWIQKKMEEEQVVFDERYKDSSAIIRRLNKENELLAKWINLKDKPFFLSDKLKAQGVNTVSVYGYSRLGAVLVSELQKTDIEVKYVIDKKGKMLNLNLPVYTLQEDFECVDAIIVAPIDLLDEVQGSIMSKANLFVIEITELFE